MNKDLFADRCNSDQYSCNHNYTTSKDEHDWLVSLGWKDEGTAWYGISE